MAIPKLPQRGGTTKVDTINFDAGSMSIKEFLAAKAANPDFCKFQGTGALPFVLPVNEVGTIYCTLTPKVPGKPIELEDRNVDGEVVRNVYARFMFLQADQDADGTPSQPLLKFTGKADDTFLVKLQPHHPEILVEGANYEILLQNTKIGAAPILWAKLLDKVPDTED